MKRSKWELCLDILNFISKCGECKKTRIMYGARLDWKTFKRHFTFLLENNIVQETKNSKNCKIYRLTDKGNKLLSRLKNVKKDLG